MNWRAVGVMAMLAVSVAGFGTLIGAEPRSDSVVGGRVVGGNVVGDSVNRSPLESPSLKKTLEAILRARRQEEFDYIEEITDRVDAGTLPRSLVESTMKWVRRKNPRRPLQYFQAALKVRAKEIGVELAGPQLGDQK